MKSIKDFINNNPVLSYFVLTFVLSWIGFLLILGPNTFPGTLDKFDTVFPLAILLMLTGPTIASLLLTGLLEGGAGLRELFSRLIKWRVSFRWYAVALLLAPILAAATLLVLKLNSPIFIANNKLIVLLSGLGAGITTILEELGWTGFATPRLRQRYSIFTTGLIIGVLWSAWHLLQILWISGFYAGDIAMAIFLPLNLLASVATLTPYRVLLVWIYDRTGSLLVTTLMHASLSASTVIIFRPIETGAPFLAFQYLFALALWVFVALVAATSGGSLSRQKDKS